MSIPGDKVTEQERSLVIFSTLFLIFSVFLLLFLTGIENGGFCIGDITDSYVNKGIGNCTKWSMIHIFYGVSFGDFVVAPLLFSIMLAIAVSSWACTKPVFYWG